MNTIRELIILEFLARAAVIVNTGSPQAYSTNIGTNIIRARKSLDPDELPAVVIWPLPEENTNAYGKCKHTMQIRADGIAKFGTTDQSVIGEQILGDLIKCFTSTTWDRRRPKATSPVTYDSPYAESIVYTSGGTDSTLEDGAVAVGSQATFTVTYWTKIGNPYEQ